MFVMLSFKPHFYIIFQRIVAFSKIRVLIQNVLFNISNVIICLRNLETTFKRHKKPAC